MRIFPDYAGMERRSTERDSCSLFAFRSLRSVFLGYKSPPKVTITVYFRKNTFIARIITHYAYKKHCIFIS